MPDVPCANLNCKKMNSAAQTKCRFCGDALRKQSATPVPQNQAQGIVTIRYTARTDKPSTITIDHFRTSTDTNISVSAISGTPFPSVPIVVEAVGNNVTVVSPPAESNGWQRVILRVQGKGLHEAVVSWSVF